MTAINLIPDEVFARRGRRRALRCWALRCAIALLVTGISSIALVRLAGSRTAEVGKLTGECAVLHERVRFAETLIARRDQMVLNQEVVDLIRHGRTAGWVLDRLGEALPSTTYLSFLAYDRNEASEDEGEKPGTTPPGGLHLQGRAPGHEEIGEVIRRLSAVPQLDEVTLLSVRDPGGTSESGELEFELACRLAAGPARE